MKVKIGNEIFDSFDQPIAVMLTSDEERSAAARSIEGGHVYASIPDTIDRSTAMVWLNEGWGDLTFKTQVKLADVLSSIPFPEPPKFGLKKNGS